MSGSLQSTGAAFRGYQRLLFQHSTGVHVTGLKESNLPFTVEEGQRRGDQWTGRIEHLTIAEEWPE